MRGKAVERAELLDPRRAARVMVRCVAEVQHRFSRWQAETEDVGPEGVQLVTPRLVSSGQQMRLMVVLPALERTVTGSATVVWSRAAAPSRLGLRFQPDPVDRGWFDALLAADPLLAAAAGRRPARLAARARLFFGEPPRLVVDFSRDELAVLRRVQQGMAVVDLAAGFGTSPDRLLGALFALLSRRSLLLDPSHSRGAGPWRDVLARAETAEAASGLAAPFAPRPREVQALLDEGQRHLSAGRISLAAARYHEAKALAPGDAEILERLRNLGPFA